MTSPSLYDPYELFNKLNELWEKQMNIYFALFTHQGEVDKHPSAGIEAYTRNLDFFRKNQEVIANILNIPTKRDLTVLANRNLQTEEKLDSLEEQLFGLQEGINATNKDIESLIGVSKEIIKLTKQLKTELVKTKKELAETKNFQSDLIEMKKELTQLNTFKEEFEMLKTLIDKGEQKEPAVAVSTAPSK